MFENGAYRWELFYNLFGIKMDHPNKGLTLLYEKEYDKSTSVIIILFVATTVKLEIVGQEVAWPTQTADSMSR